MPDRRFFLELAAITGAAILLALIANAIASRERKIALVGNYPRAMEVTKRPPPPPDTPVQLADPPVSAADPLAVPLAGMPEATTTAATTTAPAAVAAAPQQQAVAARPAKAFPPHPDRPWVEINYEDTRELWERKALVIDARRTAEYLAGHIAGAMNIAVWEGDADQRVGQLAMGATDTDAPIVIYCSGGNCEDSHMLAEKMFGVGFNNVLVYREGYPEWQQRGGAIERGAR
jgi:rhodanese-related sulfurtransferase